MVDSYVYADTSILKNKFNIKVKEELENKEELIFNRRYREICKSKINMKDNVEMLKYVNQYLFSDLYSFAGEFRKIDIEKEEIVLKGFSMNYAKAKDIETKLLIAFSKYSIREEMLKLSKEKLCEKICYLTSNIWKIHPFRDCNTRTVITFMIKYLEKFNIIMKNDLFKRNSTYLRDALVAASYEDKELNVHINMYYLYKIVYDSLVKY